MHAVKIQFCRRELTDTHTNPYFMSLFTHAVSLGSSAAVSDSVPTLESWAEESLCFP